MKQRPERRRARHLRAQFLVTAGRADKHLRAGAQAEVDGVVGRRVAGVQRDHDVDRFRFETAQVALHKTQPFAARAFSGAVAEIDEIGAQFDARDLGRDAEAPAQMLVHGKGEIALAAAEVDDANRSAGAKRGGVQCAIEHLQKLVDLFPLARHRRNEAMSRVGDAEIDEKGQVERQRATLRSVVRRQRGRCRLRA